MSADYQLVRYSSLPAGRQAVFADLVQNGELFGLLIPTQAVQRGVKAVDQAFARWFEALSQPGGSAVAPPPSIEIVRLILDGIIEVEVEREFLSGPRACDWLGPLPRGPRDVLGRLSHDALETAFDVPIEDPRQMSSWLYLYNGAPFSPTWCRRLGSESTLLSVLDLQYFDTDYLRNEHGAWWSWSRHDRDPEDPLPYKLYVSPRPDVGFGAISAVLAVCGELGVPSFKLGRGVHGLLRPDKLVAYLPTWEALYELGGRLRRALAGAPVQGVPFTAALTEDGLLSWGMDPPMTACLPGWRGMESWRLWLTNNLARTLLHAREAGERPDRAIAFSLARLGFEGVDTLLWVPSEDLWPIEEQLQ